MLKRQSSTRDAESDLAFTGHGDYMAIKKRKLQKQFDLEKSNARISRIFEGVVIFVNGYTKPSADELKHLMMVHGGRYDQYYSRSRTTHIIAINLPHVKVKQLKEGEKVVRPEWITESVAAGTLLSYEKYQLYLPAARINFQPQGEASSRPDDVKSGSDNKSLGCGSEIKNDSGLCNGSTKTLRAGEDNFLKEYYGHSRLHHISTAGAKFKEYINELRKNHGGNFPGLDKLREWKRNQATPIFETQDKIIMHLDMDCFFVSAGLRNRLDLKGLPVAVCHSHGGSASKSVKRPPGSDVQYELNYYGLESKDRSDFGSMAAISSCNYEARKSGVRNGTFLGDALKICPNLQTIPYDFDSYEEISQILYDTVAGYTLEIEAVSCDELFIDCTQVLQETKATPLEFASFLREEIHSTTGCTASAGLAENVLLARLTTKKAKPNGQYLLKAKEVAEFIGPQPVRELPGVGYSLRYRLESLGIVTCADLQKLPLDTLQKEFGPKTGLTLHQHCRGKEERSVQSSKERKSVSAEVNYGMRFQTIEEAEKFLNELAEEVSTRLKNVHKKGKGISLKLKVRKKDAPVETAKFMGHGVCDNVTRSTSLNASTDSASIIARECITLLRNSGIGFADLRGVGIQMGRLDSVEQSRSISDYLNAEASTSKATNTNQSSERWNIPSATELDASVLDALPDEIRHEIFEAYQISESQVSPKKMSSSTGIEPTSIATRKTNNRAELGGAESLDDVKQLLEEWIESTEEPGDEDVNVISEYLGQLVVENLEKLDLVLKHFYRKIRIKNLDDWKTAYTNVLKGVQLLMTKTYGSALKIQDFCATK